MAAASFDIAHMPPDHAETSERRISSAGPWFEPFLTKHSKFYRKHFTRDGRRESKTERRASVISDAERRNSSSAADAAGTEDHLKGKESSEGRKSDES